MTRFSKFWDLNQEQIVHSKVLGIHDMEILISKIKEVISRTMRYISGKSTGNTSVIY